MIALLDVKYSNLKAYANLLTYLGVSFEVVECADKIKNYHDTLVLPGVSSFKSISEVCEARGFKRVLKSIFNQDRKVIGTCAGMHYFFETSDEGAEQRGLEIIPARVKIFPSVNKITLNVGWKKTNNGEFYFVHNYYAELHSLMEDYQILRHNDVNFVSEFRIKNFFGIQYHPEKSGEVGINRIKEILDT